MGDIRNKESKALPVSIKNQNGLESKLPDISYEKINFFVLGFILGYLIGMVITFFQYGV